MVSSFGPTHPGESSGEDKPLPVQRSRIDKGGGRLHTHARLEKGFHHRSVALISEVRAHGLGGQGSDIVRGNKVLFLCFCQRLE